MQTRRFDLIGRLEDVGAAVTALALGVALALGSAGCSGLTTASTPPGGGNPPPASLSISNPSATGISASAATITWATNISATSQVEYGPSASYGQSTPTDSTLVVNHSMALGGLTASTTYHYRIHSRDANNQEAVSGDLTLVTSATPDTTPPTISAVTANGISASGAIIQWTTSEPSTSQVDYGTSATYGQSTSLDSTMATGHSMALAGLSASTLYHYRVRSRDAAGNLATSQDFTFTTSAASSNPPVISNVSASNITTTSARVSWSTDKAATSQVDYGTTTSYGQSTAADSLLVTSHLQTVSGLSASTLYHYRVRSVDVGNLQAVSGDFTFNTLANTPPPVISGISATPNSTIATVTWTTDTLSDSQVDYGTTTSYGQSSALDSNFVAAHSITLTGLTPATLYHFRVKSRDAASNLSTSGDNTFTTLTQPTGGIPPNLGWFAIPNTHLLSVCPPNNFGGSGYDFSSFCRSVVGAWNGGIADTGRNRLIIWGGGHSDYSGNEIYSLNLNDLTLTRLNDPTVPVSGSSNQTCPETIGNGQPNSRHTYAGLSYIQHADRMFSFSGSLACGSGSPSRATWALNLSNLQWQRRDPTNGVDPPSGWTNLASVSDYDPNTRLVFLFDRENLLSYNYDTDTYTDLNSNASLSLFMNGAIDPKRKLFILVGVASDVSSPVMQVVNVAAGSNYALQNWTSQVSGCSGMFQRNPGVAYDPVQDRMVIWGGGNTVYIFNPDTRSCTSQTFSGGPGSQIGTGTYGRFRYFPSSGVFALVNSVSQDAFTLRLTPPTP